jgi:hypothetical protein
MHSFYIQTLLYFLYLLFSMDMDEIKKLPPQERIKKLKALEEKQKKELEAAEQLEQSSLQELTEAKQKAVEQVRRFEKSFNKPQEIKLEEVVEDSEFKKQNEKELMQQQTAITYALQDAHNARDELSQLYDEWKNDPSSFYSDPHKQEQLYNAAETIDRVQNYQSASDAITEEVDITKRMLKAMGKYQG